MKYITVFVLIVSTYFNLNAQNSFSAKLHIPVESVQGETSVFRLDIIKPQNVRGYTAFTQKFPEGFFVEAIETNGAEFSYTDNILTITWLRIPADSKVSVLYEVSSIIGLTGKFNFSGNLTYLIGNKQGKFELKKYELTVLKEKKLIVNNDLTVSDEGTVFKVNPVIFKDVSCIRKINYNKKKDEYDVELKLKKKKDGFYNIVEKIPGGFSFNEVNSAGAKVIRSNSNIQFIWDSVLDSKEVIIKYKLKSAEDENFPPVIQGKLSFIFNMQIINIPIVKQE